MKTKFESSESALAARKWVEIDAEGQVVGRLASKIAAVLRGKNNPKYVPHNDCGDFVVVINAAKVRFSGDKLNQKLYRHHTGFIGGVKEIKAGKLLAEKPERVLRNAVQGMLPKTALGKKQLRKLRIYTGSEHKINAQKPQPMVA